MKIDREKGNKAILKYDKLVKLLKLDKNKK